MTISTVRMYFWPSKSRERLERYLGLTMGGGFEEWMKGRLKPIRADLGGPEVKGVNIVNFMFCDPSRTLGGRHGQWARTLNTLHFTWVCDLEPLRDQPPLENVELLMPFCGAWCEQAPWPQVRALGPVLSAPLSHADRTSLPPLLTWPREDWFRKNLYSGPQLELAMANARRDAAWAMKEARYPRPPERGAQ